MKDLGFGNGQLVVVGAAVGAWAVWLNRGISVRRPSSDHEFYATHRWKWCSGPYNVDLMITLMDRKILLTLLSRWKCIWMCYIPPDQSNLLIQFVFFYWRCCCCCCYCSRGRIYLKVMVLAYFYGQITNLLLYHAQNIKVVHNVIGLLLIHSI